MSDFHHYLPVSDDAMNWGAYLTSAGRMNIAARQSYPPKGHPAVYQFDWRRGRVLPEFAMVFIARGQGEFESEPTGRVEFKAPTLLFLFPGVWHRYRPLPAAGWEERWICFNGEIAHRLASLGLIAPARAVAALHETARLTEQFDDLLERVRSNPVQNSILLSLHGLGLIADALESTAAGAVVGTDAAIHPPVQSGLEDPITRQAMEIIWTHSHRPISVSDIAKQLPVTRRTLDRRFTAATGRTVLDEINACRVSRAKRLLVETTLPIKTVSYLAGFSSVERMRVLFVEQEGASPSVYRETHAQPAGPSSPASG
jgi:AraC-like DNA-binding protein